MYFPEGHGVHVEAPAAVRVLVTFPAGQKAQAMVDAAEYLPAAHAVHVEAPEPVSVSVTDPAGQAAQLVAVPTAVWAAT